jgi:uncharacterized membrane protein YraQ (UPF0718 family)
MPAPVGILEYLIDGFVYGFIHALVFFPMVYGCFKQKYKFTIKESFIITEYLTTVLILAIYNMAFHIHPTSDLRNNIETLVLPIAISYVVVKFFERNKTKRANLNTEAV